MTDKTWMIYGANGYTGHLLANEAQRQGLEPILGGRNPAAVHALGSVLGLECRIFDMHDAQRAREALADIAVVVHCAGPFSATSTPMLEACMASATHYLDITGEITVFEAAQRRDAQARECAVVVCPGVGFDVIPSDCLAACLHRAMPDANQLALGFDTGSGFSPGTAKTALEGLQYGGKVRRAGVLTEVPMGYKRRAIDFGRGEKAAVTIPWGDVSTAYHSTGIDNIEFYLPAPTALALTLRALDPLRPLFALEAVQGWLKQLIAKRVHGPDQATRAGQRTWLWGEVRNPAGAVKTAHLETANGYDVTVQGALLAVRHLLDYTGPGGYFTPSRLLGERCVEQLPGSGKIVIA